MFGTYKTDDVTILLKDITGMVQPQTTEEREREIQNGRHYCEMLPIEYEPTKAYEKAYEDALSRYSKITARAVAVVAQKIWNAKGEKLVLVSLARAGTPIGILIKRYIKKKYGYDVPHYSISIIRGRGIDQNAINYILSRHEAQGIQFVDGWTGKGAIQRQLTAAIKAYPMIDDSLAVLSDPAYVAKYYGTHDDFLIASSCLNSTVSGLLSRTFLRDDIIGGDDFHGAVFYENLLDKDVTYDFIEAVEKEFSFDEDCDDEENVQDESAIEEVEAIAKEFGIDDINLVKPSIGEATRVLLRRMPWKMLVASLTDEEHLGHLYQLAREKNIEVLEYPLKHYRAVGLIKTMADT